MNTQQVVADYRMLEWMQIIKERQNSGQTIRAFCEERGITENTYFYWHHDCQKGERLASPKSISLSHEHLKCDCQEKSDPPARKILIHQRQ